MLIVQCDFDGTVTMGNVGTAIKEAFGPDNWALYHWRRHYNGWIRRSLYSFGEDDTFVKAFDHARGAANSYEPAAYTAWRRQATRTAATASTPPR